MTMTSMADDEDVEIVLQEVSKIFRCRECSRCFLSMTKYAEHFPKYHKEKSSAKLWFAPESQRSKEDGKSSSGSNTDPNENVKRPGKIMMARRTIVPKIQQNSKEAVANPDQSESHPVVTASPAVSNASASASSKTPCSQLNEPAKEVEKETSQKQDISAQSKSQSKQSCTSGTKESSGPESDNKKSVSPNANPEGFVIDVITLSDSEDESCSTSANCNTNSASIPHLVKQEVEDESPVELPGNENGACVMDENPPQLRKEVETPKRRSTPQAVESVDKKHLCSYCNKSFSRECTLQSHVKSMHQAHFDAEQKSNKKDGQSLDSAKIPKYAATPTSSRTAGGGGIRQNGKRCAVKSPAKKTPKRLKKQESESDPVSPIRKNTDRIEVNEHGTPVYSCKWCKEKFLRVEDLRNHAINIHIKYRIPGEHFGKI